MDDIRYSELRFLRALYARQIDSFNPSDAKQADAVGLSGTLYLEMASYLLEELCVVFENGELQPLVGRLRGEVSPEYDRPRGIHDWHWKNPREGLFSALSGSASGLQRLRITYRGVRRIDELQDLLRKERVLDDFGVLQSIRYFNADLEHAIERASEAPVSVIYADMDNFRPINMDYGHEAGDVVMKAYLEVVRDSIGLLGDTYRGVGDEAVALIVGQGHARAIELAESIRQRVAQLQVEHRGHVLPPVTASIGVATTPPESRSRDILSIAEGRNRLAKKTGKNRVVAG